MKPFSLLLRLCVLAMVAAHAHAQVIERISVSPQTVKVGEPVTVTAKVGVSDTNYCGFIVFFGDGSSVEGVSDLKQAAPFVVQHTYTKAGEFTLSMGGRHVQSHPNCGGADKFAVVKVLEAAPLSQAPVSSRSAAASACPKDWKLVRKSYNAKTKAFACSAKPGTVVPADRAACPGDLTYFENIKKGQLGCRP